MKIIMKRIRFNYSKSVFTVTLRSTLEIDGKPMESLLVGNGVHMRLNVSFQVTRADEWYQFATLFCEASHEEAYSWKIEAQLIRTGSGKKQKPVTVRETFLYGQSSSILAGILLSKLSDSKFRDILKITLTYTKIFDLAYGFRFTEVMMENIGAKLMAPNFLQKASLATKI